MTAKGQNLFVLIISSSLYLLRGSKYIQAKVGQTYKSVKNDLNIGKIVLFSGTGCQNKRPKKIPWKRL